MIWSFPFLDQLLRHGSKICLIAFAISTVYVTCATTEIFSLKVKGLCTVYWKSRNLYRVGGKTKMFLGGRKKEWDTNSNGNWDEYKRTLTVYNNDLRSASRKSRKGFCEVIIVTNKAVNPIGRLDFYEEWKIADEFKSSQQKGETLIKTFQPFKSPGCDVYIPCTSAFYMRPSSEPQSYSYMFTVYLFS